MGRGRLCAPRTDRIKDQARAIGAPAEGVWGARRDNRQTACAHWPAKPRAFWSDPQIASRDHCIGRWRFVAAPQSSLSHEACGLRSMTAPRLDLTGVTKRFPGVIANDDVAFSIAPGEMHALLGENGAGKSTLVKMIYGVMRPDAGVMRLDGEAYTPNRPSDARARGVGMVFQHFSLFEALTVGENVALGMNAADIGRDLNDQIFTVSDAYGLSLDPSRTVGSLSVGERQRVEIVRCLLQNPRLLIMDEPTSVLTLQEVEDLFRTLRALVADGCSILYISHKLEEIRAHCDRATVLRGGKVVGHCDPAEATSRSLAELMVGMELALPTKSMVDFEAERLSVHDLSLPADDPFGVSLQNISFSVRAGEILGVAGVAGNGQGELLDALSGERLVDADAILLDQTPIGRFGPTARRGLGFCAAPEERLGHGAAPDMSLWENTLLSARSSQDLVRSGMLNLSAAKAYAAKIVSMFDVRTSGVDRHARTLSGGNLQKFIIGREILQDPKVLAILQPTWGVDAAAAAAIHRAIQDLAENGAAVLLISQDLDELMAVATTFAVIAGGRLSQPQPTDSMTVEEIGILMGGADGAASSGSTS